MSTPTSGPSSTPAPTSASASTSSSIIGSILSAPGAVVYAGVGYLAGLAGFTRQQTAEIAKSQGVVKAATNAAGSSSDQLPAQQLQAVVESEEVQTAMATAAAAEINSSSSSAPISRIDEAKAKLAEAAKGKSSSASKNREAECLALFGTKHAVTVGGGGGSSGANATSSISKYVAPRMGHAFEVYQKQAYLATPKGELDALRKQLTAEIEKLKTGEVDNDKEVTRLEKLVAKKQAEVIASIKSRTRKSRQQRRRTRRSRH